MNFALTEGMRKTALHPKSQGISPLTPELYMGLGRANVPIAMAGTQNSNAFGILTFPTLIDNITVKVSEINRSPRLKLVEHLPDAQQTAEVRANRTRGIGFVASVANATSSRSHFSAPEKQSKCIPVGLESKMIDAIAETAPNVKPMIKE